MTRDEESDRVWLEHIVGCIDEIRAYTGGTTNTSEQSRETQRAVERVLQILAESTQRLSPAVKATEAQNTLRWRRRWWLQVVDRGTASLRSRTVNAGIRGLQSACQVVNVPPLRIGAGRG